MNKQDVLQLFDKHYGDRYKVDMPSIKSEKNNYFFMAKDNKEKYLIVVAGSDLVRKFE